MKLPQSLVYKFFKLWINASFMSRVYRPMQSKTIPTYFKKKLASVLDLDEGALFYFQK